MSNPAPILNVTGKVHSVIDRPVEPAPARPEERDPETGQLIRQAYPARDGYTVVDVTVLTDEGGFATVSILPAAVKEMGGEIPSQGDTITYPVRSYVSWQRRGQRSFPVVGLSVAGDVHVARKSKSNGARVASVSSASA